MSSSTFDPAAAAELDRKMRLYEHLLPPMSPDLLVRMASQTPAGATLSVADLQTPDQPAPTTAAAHWPALTPAEAHDRALGCLLGLAIGDAVGTSVEFAPRGSFAPVTDLTGGGPFNLAPGEWTDDTTMALCLAESLLAKGTVDPLDFISRLLAWLDRGENTVSGRCFDIGQATRAALERFRADGHPAAGSQDGDTAGNGSLVRLAPLAIFSSADAELARSLARKQSRSTHAADECIDACALFINQLVDALTGADKAAVMRQRVMALTPKLLFISGGDWKDKTRDQIRSSGYVVDTLEAALWSVWHTESFRDAVLTAANLGDDADSVAACAGQLAGALYGASSIPPEWLARLAWRERIAALAGSLFKPPGG